MEQDEAMARDLAALQSSSEEDDEEESSEEYEDPPLPGMLRNQ